MDITAKVIDVNPDLLGHVAWLKQKGVSVDGVLQQTLKELPARLPAAAVRRIQRMAVLNVFLATFSKRYRGTATWETLSAPPFHARERDLYFMAVVLANTSFDYNRELRKSHRTRRGGDWALAARLGRPEEFENFATSNADFIARRLFERFDPAHPAASRSAVKYLRKTAIGLFLRDSVDRARANPTGLVSYILASREVSRRVRVAALIAYMPLALSKEDLSFVHDRFGWEPMSDGRYLIQEVAEHLGFKSRGALYTRLYKLRRGAKKVQAALQAKAAARDERRRANEAKFEAKLEELKELLAERRRELVSARDADTEALTAPGKRQDPLPSSRGGA